MSPLTDAFARSLGGAFAGRGADLCRWMDAAGLDRASLEASVRGGGRGGDTPTGQRMMIERTPLDAVPGFFRALGVELPARCAAALGEAERLGLLAIVGWDAAESHRPCAKLYVNASDASAATRADLSRALDLAPADAAHVVGFNVARDALTLKVYAQSGETPAGLDPSLAARLAPSGAADAISGWVTARTVLASGSHPRAVFAGLKAGHPGALALLAGLEGFRREAVEQAAPFELGAVTSVGLDADDPARWTVYFKPRGVSPASWALEPVLVARDARAEVGLFVEPVALGRRAWATVGEHAVSYRLRAGTADPARLTALMTWACARLAAGVAPAELHRDAPPPEPWHVVHVR